ncbi:hypothetical protein BHM03_00047183 [Ensete ventricosum]|nr:hypothetical protein BHM03_00047183 [Ensete ventricosum]
MACHALAPCRCNCTSSVRLGHIPRDDKGKAGCTGKLPSHGYKTLTSAVGNGYSLSPSILLPFPRTPNFTLPREPFGIPANLGIGGASLGHPSHLQRGLCTGSPSPRRPKRQADRALRREPPREHQSTHEVSTLTDVDGLAYSDENRSSRHLSSTPESFVTKEKGRCVVNHNEDLMAVDFGDDIGLAEKEQIILLEPSSTVRLERTIMPPQDQAPVKDAYLESMSMLALGELIWLATRL